MYLSDEKYLEHKISQVKADNVVDTITVSVPMEKEEQLGAISDELEKYSSELNSLTDQFADVFQELIQGSQDVKVEFDAMQQYVGILDSTINYIDAMSETTNLLGVNAATQAVRAGELGRGFSVAAEIRKLAQLCIDSIKLINNTLLDIKQSMACISMPVDSLAVISQEQAAQIEQIAAGSAKLYSLSESLLKLSNSLP